MPTKPDLPVIQKPRIPIDLSVKTTVTPKVVIAGFAAPAVVDTAKAAAGTTLVDFVEVICQNATAALTSDIARLQADLTYAQNINGSATFIWQTVSNALAATATPSEAQLTQWLNQINTETPPLQSDYASVYADAIGAFNDMQLIRGQPPTTPCDLSKLLAFDEEAALSQVAAQGQIFNGLAGLAASISTSLQAATTAPTTAQVAKGMTDTINIQWYGWDQVLNEATTQSMITWWKNNIGTGGQDLVTQIEIP